MKARLHKILIKKIRIVGKRRPLVKKKVSVIADSIFSIGLQTPITVRKTKNGYILVAGWHRLEAAKKVGLDDIDCFVTTKKKLDRQLWTEGENLHRAELTALQRANTTKKWEELLKNRTNDQVDTPKGGRQPGDKGLSKTAKRLGTTRESIRRRRAVANLSRRVQKAAKKAGLDDNEAALLKIAREKTPEAQQKKIRELAKRKHSATGTLSLDEVKQLNTLKQTFKPGLVFIKAWNVAVPPVRKKFVKSELKPNKRLPEPPPEKDNWV